MGTGTGTGPFRTGNQTGHSGSRFYLGTALTPTYYCTPLTLFSLVKIVLLFIILGKERAFKVGITSAIRKHIWGEVEITHLTKEQTKNF